jgi:hypothetical protein
MFAVGSPAGMRLANVAIESLENACTKLVSRAQRSAVQRCTADPGTRFLAIKTTGTPHLRRTAKPRCTACGETGSAQFMNSLIIFGPALRS